jgi:thioesterase domain-containing protein
LGYDFDYRGAARLGGNYAPPGHTVAMDLFTSADSVDESGSPALGWESVHQGSIVVHASPGSHFSLVTEAGWRVLAENVRACLETLPSTNRSRAV